MVKDGHINRTIVMPVELDERLILYLQEINAQERERGIPKRQQTDGSKVAIRALEEYLEKHGA